CLLLFRAAPLASVYFVRQCRGDHRDLPSFPTRRSSDLGAGAAHPAGAQLRRRLGRADLRAVPESRRASPTAAAAPAAPGDGGARSEEHTSELQSRENLVCRLLLEKKKSQTIS